MSDGMMRAEEIEKQIADLEAKPLDLFLKKELDLPYESFCEQSVY